MKPIIKNMIQIMLAGILLLTFAVPGFAKVSMVPGKAVVEQGLKSLTLDVDGAEKFRYTAKKGGIYLFHGKLKPGSRLKIIFKADLENEKSLQLTGRSCIVKMRITAVKGKDVIDKKSFSKENKSNLFLNYAVPKDADLLEINETFELYNDSKNAKFNKKVTSHSLVSLSVKDAAGNSLGDFVQKAGIKLVDSTDGKANVVSLKKDENRPKNGKIDAGISDIESKESNTGMFVAIAVFILLAAGAGLFFFMKKKKASQAAAAETDQKEKLRRQEIQQQQEIQKQQAAQKKQEMRRIYEEMEQRNRKLEKEQAHRQEALKGNASSQNAGAVSTAVPPVGAVPVRFCSNCGAMIEPGSAFCGECGQPLATMNIDPVQQRYQTVPIASAEVPSQMAFIPQVQTSTVAMAGRELDCGEMNKAVFGTVHKAAADVLSPVNAFAQGISSFVNGILHIIKKPKALIGTMVLAVLWFVLGWLGDSDSPVLKALSWLTFSEGGFDRSVPGAVCGALGKGMVATALVSLFAGGTKNTFKGVGALFSGHGEKRDVVSLIIGAVVGLVMYFVFSGPDASGKTAMAGIAGLLLSLQALGGENGIIYELAQSLTAGKVNGVRTAVAGKCDGLLTGLALGFALATVLSVIR